MRKYTISRQAANKRPHPSRSPEPQVVLDSLPSHPSPGTKRSRTNGALPQHGSHSAVLSTDRESSEQQVSAGQGGSDSEESSHSQHQEISANERWMCFCGNHTTDIAELCEALIQVSTSYDNPSETMGPLQMEDVIERVESAAEFFLYVWLEQDAFQLYALFLKWALNHVGHFCQCAHDLVHRARVGCALSAINRSDLEIANALLEQTKSFSSLNDRQSLASWLFYESLFTWKLYNSRGLICFSGHSNWSLPLTNQLDGIFNAALDHDTAADWLKLGAMLCEKLSTFVNNSDAAKGHIKDLQQRLQDSLEGNPEPSLDYSIQMFNSGAVRYCMRWMQDSLPPLPLLPLSTRDKCHFRGRKVCPLHDTDPDPSGPHPDTHFLAYWARLRRDLRDGSIPVWFEKLKASGIRPTEFLATVIRGQEFPFQDSGGNASSECSLRDEEITQEVRCCHVSFHMAFFYSQILKGALTRAGCRSAGRELVMKHLAIKAIPG